ncbi:hypothetical protein [Tepidimonas sp.]|uniref:hypothetical protein n=1 Tax=Tepidimonas sp. TaxID=2002775 RepID=UPI003919BF4D
MREHAISFAAFLRHRYRAHVQGWLAILVGVLWGYYIDLYWHEPLWAVVPAAFIAAFFVVAVGVLVAVVLRVPWWLFAPLALVSMSLEWRVRKVAHRPWQRRQQPREPWLSNPFARWQGWRLQRLRRQRARARTGARILVLLTARATRLAPHPAAHRPGRPAWSPLGLGRYVGEVFALHWAFWMLTAPVGITLWFWLVDDQELLVALILGVLLWLLGSVVLVIPLATAVLALASALVVGAGLTPLQRQAAVQQAQAERAVRAQAAPADAPAATSAPQRVHWVWPLLLGLWIGSAWGGDE